LIAKVFENLLQDHIISKIENLFDSNVQNILFQQDGGLHYAIRIQKFLN